MNVLTTDSSTGDLPVRASDQERERVAARLRTAAGEGRLSLDELAERLERALSAATRSELDPLTADLPQETATARADARRWILAIMSGVQHRGRWRVAARCTVVNLMGGADLDLTDAIVQDAETEIRVFSLMGGSDIIVPPGVHVEFHGFALMGGNELRLDDAPTPAPSAPVVRVRAYSIMGGTDVKSNKRDRSRSRLAGLPPPPPPL